MSKIICLPLYAVVEKKKIKENHYELTRQVTTLYIEDKIETGI